jgi:hypothetical protein
MNKAPRILSHNFTGKSLVIVYQNEQGRNQTKIVEQSHVNWPIIFAHYKKGEFTKLIPLLDIVNAVAVKSGNKFTIKNDQVFYNGQPVNGYFFDKLLFFFKHLPNQFPRLLLFAENLFSNPSAQARDSLYKFLENGNMPLTEDGCFLAYKGVREDYYSITAGSKEGLILGETLLEGSTKSTYHLRNKIGDKLVVKRESVDSNSHNACSCGLHAGSYKYANDFKGHGRLMVVKINPRDVVSVPHSDAQKLRCCQYEVIAEDGKPLDEVRDSNFDKAAKVRHGKPRRDANGRFV